MTSEQTVAALYVQRGGIYWDRPGVDAWDEARDARRYAGPYPVVAHPPCARWCRLAKFCEMRWGHAVGDDGGTFAAALASVRNFGGVLEHPAWSLAWQTFALQRPSPGGGWSSSGESEWVCEVAQSAYGHRARKLTWLLYSGVIAPVELDWAQPAGEAVVSLGLNKRGNGLPRLSSKAASATPPAFADVLIALARNSRGTMTSEQKARAWKP